MLACGDGENAEPPRPSDSGTSSPDASPPEDIEGRDAGTFTIVDVPDVPCRRRIGPETILYPAAGSRTELSSISVLGARRVAQRPDGFVTFDADGANASSGPIAPSRAVTSIDAQTIGAVGLDVAGPFLSTHRPDGSSIASAIAAFDGPGFGVAVGGGNGTALMVWAASTGIRARGIRQSALTTDEAFAIAATGDVTRFVASIARADDGTFGVAFSSESADATRRRLSFVPAAVDGRVGTGYNLHVGAQPRRVIQLLPWRTGWALLLEFGNGLGAHLVFLTKDGRIDGAVRRFVGAGSGYGLATSAGELGVFALHAAPPSADDAGASDAGTNALFAAFRPFDADASPLDGWVCLGDGVTNASTAAAILGEADGYTVAFPRANGDVALARFDRRAN